MSDESTAGIAGTFEIDVDIFKNWVLRRFLCLLSDSEKLDGVDV